MTPVVPVEDVAIITISASPSKVSSRRPVRITPVQRISPLIITVPGPIPYTSYKAVPWHYGVDVYYHGIKQDLKNEEADIDVSNIVGTSKVTRSGRVFSPEISPKIIKPTIIPTAALTITPDISPVPTPVITPAAGPSGLGSKKSQVSLPGRRNLRK